MIKNEARPLALVTGATGAIGPRVVDQLLAEGYRVRTLSLDSPKYTPTFIQVEERLGDITDPATVTSAMSGVETVVHLAALLHIINPPHELREIYQRINVEGTAVVVAAAQRAGVVRVVFFSTIAVYGYTTGELLTEETTPHPNNYYAETKLAAERIILAAKCPNGKPLGTVLRLGAVYGAGIKGNYRRLLQSLARGRFVPVGNGKNRRTLVYDRDVALAAVMVARHPDAAGHIYNVSDGRFHLMNEIIAAMCVALGRKPPRLSLPLGPTRLVASILEDGARLAGFKSPVGRATIDKYTEDVAVDTRRIQAQIGFVPRYDLTTGWHETVKEMRQAGDL